MCLRYNSYLLRICFLSSGRLWEIPLLWGESGMHLRLLKFLVLPKITRSFTGCSSSCRAPLPWSTPSISAFPKLTNAIVEKELAIIIRSPQIILFLQRFDLLSLHCFYSSLILLKMTFVIFSICTGKNIDLLLLVLYCSEAEVLLSKISNIYNNPCLPKGFHRTETCFLERANKFTMLILPAS